MVSEGGQVSEDIKADTSTMKHPHHSSEPYEFNIGKALELRCVQGGVTTTCGVCETCQLNKKLTDVKDWFSKAGDQSRRRFILGLVRRFHSVDLLQSFVTLLTPVLCKDFTYARARTNPSLNTDAATMSCDRALDLVTLESNIAETWFWFQHANYWTKSNFSLSILQCCDVHLLYQAGVLAKTLMASEKMASVQDDEYEAESVSSTTYSYATDSRPDLDLLTDACSEYSRIQQDPFSGAPIDYSKELTNADSDEDESYSSSRSSEPVDPTCMVIPASVKAHSGVAKYKDFIRCLPVHLSKYILSLLDRTSLYNALCVSQAWRQLGEEVHRESHVNQQLWDEVLLMQGAAAQDVNPTYAKDIDVAVPNLLPNSWQVIQTGEEIQTTYKTEISFNTAYTGYSTRNVIMEERNVYCGPYNVMVLKDEKDLSRIIHTDGGKLIASGSQDRKVRLIDSENGKEVEPLITGHAGSIRCLAMCQDRGFVISGSYDTSIRQWSIETGKCEKIYRGLTDSIMCVEVVGEHLIAGGKDGKCKVWQLGNKKAWRTLQHRHAIMAVAMDEEKCVTGCEGGKVKVWDLKTAKIIKRLSGHHGPITAIKMDRWHIMTASRDGYALAWTSQGNHARCLTALRHPKEVLCLEFMYLRVITGSGDGKLRIWNMVTGQCLRIIRGNSRSDPITGLIAIGNRITLNTTTNLMVFNFEPIEYDYTLPDDKMPPLVQYGKYSDTPIRPQPYPYVRAQRMKKAGATNQKVIYHDSKPLPEVYYSDARRAGQTPHSAKGLSQRSLETAKFVQNMTHLDAYNAGYRTGQSRAGLTPVDMSILDDASGRTFAAPSLRSISTTAKPPQGHKRPGAVRPKVSSQRSGVRSAVSVGGFQVGKPSEESEQCDETHSDLNRRVSWAFEHPELPPHKDIGLTEMKSLLRSQMRAKGEVVPPDFIYLTVNQIQAKKKTSESQANMERNQQQQAVEANKKVGRPTSSPGRIDPRTKIPMTEEELEQLLREYDEADLVSEAGSKVSKTSKGSRMVRTAEPRLDMPKTTAMITSFKAVPLQCRNHETMYSRRVRTSIPPPKVLRPHTATVAHTEGVNTVKNNLKSRPKTAVSDHPSSTASKPAMVSISAKPKTHGYSTSSTEVSMVPMLMYPSDMAEKINQIKVKNRASKLEATPTTTDHAVGKVSPYNMPLRTHVNFKLYTHEQVAQQIQQITDAYQKQKVHEVKVKEQRAKATWLAKVKSQGPGKVIQNSNTKSTTPLVCEAT